MLDTVFFNGEFLDREKARLHVSDLSVLRGYGVFDYFRYADGQPRFMADHLARFARSAAGLGLELPLATSQLSEVVLELIDRNGGGDGGIRFVLTGGYAADGYTPTLPNLVGLPYLFRAPAERLYTEGCRVLLHHYERQLPTIKSIDYLEGIRIKPQLAAAKADFPLYVDRDNKVRESDRSNYLIVKNGVLLTPKENILLGITRKHVLQLASELDLPIQERNVSVSELLTADEAIICSSVKGVMPITQVVSLEKSSDYLIGPITRQLMAAWR